MIQILVQEKKKLQDENVELQEEASMLETKLESMNKSLRMLNNESKVLDEILEAEKKGKSMKGNGFDFKCTNQEGQSTKKSFVASEGQIEFKKQVGYQMSDMKSQRPFQHVRVQIKVLKM